MSTSCPSAAWDRHINEQDEANAAEAQFYKEHRALIVQVAASLAHTLLPDATDHNDIKCLVDVAGEIVLEIVNRGEMPE